MTIKALLCCLLLAATRLPAQDRGATALGELVDGLGTTARVLMAADQRAVTGSRPILSAPVRP